MLMRWLSSKLSCKLVHQHPTMTVVRTTSKRGVVALAVSGASDCTTWGQGNGLTRKHLHENGLCIMYVWVTGDDHPRRQMRLRQTSSPAWLDTASWSCQRKSGCTASQSSHLRSSQCPLSSLVLDQSAASPRCYGNALPWSRRHDNLGPPTTWHPSSQRHQMFYDYCTLLLSFKRSHFINSQMAERHTRYREVMGSNLTYRAVKYGPWAHLPLSGTSGGALVLQT